MIKKFPLYAVIPYILMLLFQFFVYWGSKLINHAMFHHNWTLPFDEKVPFVKEWIWIYIISYALWAVIPLLIAYFGGKKAYYQYLTIFFITLLVSFICFVTIPTTIVRPEVEGNSLSAIMTRLIYKSDVPNNLFPSLHVILSWIGFSTMRYTSASKRMKWFLFISAVLITISTQTIKQHYIVDAISGIVLSEVVTYIVIRFNRGQLAESMFTKLNQKFKTDRVISLTRNA